MDILDSKHRYVLEEKVGEGAFGEVYRARDIVTGGVVAMKLARPQRIAGEDLLPKTLLREVWALEALRGSAYIAQLVTRFARGGAVALIFEYADCDLRRLLDGDAPPEAIALSWQWMLLRALEHIHSVGIMHRDVKPSNLLVSLQGELALADFGQCRPLNDDQDYTHQVSTRWYRAPELLFGAKRYSEAVDVWAAAAVLAEMLKGDVVFPGNSDIDQLVVVFKLLGSPSPCRWPSAHLLPDFDKIVFPDSDSAPLTSSFPTASPQALDLLNSMLHLEPAWRSPPHLALQHALFLRRAPSADVAAYVALRITQTSSYKTSRSFW